MLALRIYKYFLSPFLHAVFGGGCVYRISCSDLGERVLLTTDRKIVGIFIISKRIFFCSAGTRVLRECLRDRRRRKVRLICKN